MLFRRKIILGVTGSIAAYKSAFLARLLVKAGAEVRVIMTRTSKDFITPLTLSTLSRNPVHSSFTLGEQGEWVNHVEMGLWADALLIAPASANTLAKCANGLCENLLQAVYLSSRCPVFFAPAMDLDMWQHPGTRENLKKLSGYGNTIIEPASGELASGLVGEGRMAEPEDIVRQMQDFFSRKQQMKGRKILITAGPTREAIDAVRYISNHSSGKMGYALAEELAARGAQVTLVSGPVSLHVRNSAIKVIGVTTAAEMHEMAVREFPGSDAAILTAAVADYRLPEPAPGKIKKSDSTLTLQLEPTSDILRDLGEMKSANQLLAGFALETGEGKKAAEEKLRKKNLDFIVLNELSEENNVFGSSDNRVSIYTRAGEWKSFPLQSKALVARDIGDQLNELFRNV